MVMSRKQVAGRSHSAKTDKSFFFERVEAFKYLETRVTNHNSIREEIRSRLTSGNAIIRCRIFCLPVCYPKNL